MKNIQTKKSLSEFSDRDLLELILSNQVQIYRRIKAIEYETGSDEGETAKTFGDTFMSLWHGTNEVLDQIEDEFKNQ